MMRRPSGEYATALTLPLCPTRGSPTTAPDSASQIRIVLSSDPVTTRVPFGEYFTLLMNPACPVHSSGGAGQDDWFPTRILMALVNSLLKILDKGDCEGRNGQPEI